MKKYTRELGRQLLDALPDDVVAIACDAGGLVYSFREVPCKESTIWKANRYNIIGYYECDDWEDSLVVKRWKPEVGEEYYVPDLLTKRLYDSYNYCDDEYNEMRLGLNLICKTKEEALEKAKKMIDAIKEDL